MMMHVKQVVYLLFVLPEIVTSLSVYRSFPWQRTRRGCDSCDNSLDPCFLLSHVTNTRQIRSRRTNRLETTSLHAKQQVNIRPGSLEDATSKLGRVPYGEASRKYRRTVYTETDWLVHRSNDRLLDNLSSMFYSGVVRQVKNKIFLVSCVALFVTLWNDWLVVNYHFDSFTLPHLVLPTVPFLLFSPALGLLLVFRTNASYQRWLEGARLWGTVKAQARNLVRMASTFVDTSSPEDKQAVEELSVAVWILSRSIMNRYMATADESDYREQLQRECQHDVELVDRFLAADDRATAALMEVSLVLDHVPIDEKRRVEIDKSLVILGDVIMSCDRIFGSPVPLVYTRHTARFLSLWLLLLPLAIHDEFRNVLQTGLPVIPAVAILSLFLFGIEELAVNLEEPFTILPLQKYCDDIRTSTRSMVEWSAQSRTMRKSKRDATQ